MKVKRIVKDGILFDNGQFLTYFIEKYSHDVYEYYIDFLSVNKKILEYEFDEETLQIINITANDLIEERLFESDDDFVVGFIIKDEKLEKSNKFFIPVFKTRKTVDSNDLKLLEWEVKNHRIGAVIPSNRLQDVSILKEIKDREISNSTVLEVIFGASKILLYRSNNIMELPETYRQIKDNKEKPFKIEKVTNSAIKFTNGKMLVGYAYTKHEMTITDFREMDPTALEMDFYENDLVFENVNGKGFRFGNIHGNMVFVPCKSIQQGYRSIDIFYDGKWVVSAF